MVESLPKGPNIKEGQSSPIAKKLADTRDTVTRNLAENRERMCMLEARVRQLETENAQLRAELAVARVGMKDPEMAALEAEVAAMLESGNPPERYSERADKTENTREFLSRVYGRYLTKGKEVIYLNEIRRLDPKFANALEVACNRAGKRVSELIPTRKDKTDRLIAAVGGEENADAVAKLSHAYRSRSRRKEK